MSLNKEGNQKTSFCLIPGDQKKSPIMVPTDVDSDLYLKNMRLALPQLSVSFSSPFSLMEKVF